MGSLFNNGSQILKLIVRVHIYHILIHIKTKNCSLENWIFKNFFLKIYRNQTNYTSCLPMVGGSLRVLRLPPPLQLVAMI